MPCDTLAFLSAGTTLNKAFTLVWNCGIKGQSSLLILFLSLAAGVTVGMYSDLQYTSMNITR